MQQRETVFRMRLPGSKLERFSNVFDYFGKKKTFEYSTLLNVIKWHGRAGRFTSGLPSACNSRRVHAMRKTNLVYTSSRAVHVRCWQNDADSLVLSAYLHATTGDGLRSSFIIQNRPNSLHTKDFTRVRWPKYRIRHDDDWRQLADPVAIGREKYGH